ncbi:hypothetical protein PE067_00070 [Paracoccus sp. DMF-8]|uniref:hypothetical protein n=1 Tax=Paracoccus sp. DMF-8 TaxID=3019445 RepID=UPI0023E8BD2E|nr:hypothetical protein [Paracoccus sp. DMF-8]MDF3604692.1 hypothetical protein [Paracoccus sp. DMF-8]
MRRIPRAGGWHPAAQRDRRAEIGVKARLFGGDAQATASLFEIKEANRARRDGVPDRVAADGSTFSIATGETRSRGA